MPAASRRHRRGPFAWERRGHPLLPMPAFLRRLLFSLGLGVGFIFVSLAIGMEGYAYFEGMGLVEDINPEPKPEDERKR